MNAGDKKEWINLKQRKAGCAKNVFFQNCFQEAEERIRSRKVHVCISNRANDWKSPQQCEGRGDKISHKNSSLAISHFLARLVLSMGSQAMSELAHFTCVCMCMSVCLGAHMYMCQKKRAAERSQE